MKRKLFKQMLNEWRSNIWLVVELVIVLIVMQWIFTLLSSLYYIHKNSLPVDLGDIYVTDKEYSMRIARGTCLTTASGRSAPTSMSCFQGCVRTLTSK